ncbi:hypothetical protein [Legionella sp. W05-934-2]|jgi:flavin-binding protein dodecin|uniref:hypothetical protein n=1 Tax=Legionella sp. W05-934-2 TaxID=1198649 RepID=UPI0034633668
MKNNNKQDILGQSNSNLDEAINSAISQGKIDAHRYKVIEMIGLQQNNKKSYQVVLTEREE